MKLCHVRFSLAVEHPALGGGHSRARDTFYAEGHADLKDGVAFAMETISDPPGVLLTADGHARVVNWAKVIHADPQPAQKPQGYVNLAPQQQGKKR